MIAKRLIYRIIWLSVLVIVAATLVQAGFRYEAKRDYIVNNLDVLVQQHRTAITDTVWVLNLNRLERILQGILSHPEISAVKVSDAEGNILASQTLDYQSTEDVGKSARLIHTQNGQESFIGHLHIYASYQNVLDDIKRETAWILLTNILLVFSIVLAILFMLTSQVSRPLRRLATYAHSINMSDDDVNWSVEHPETHGEQDELYELINALDAMQQKLSKSYHTVKATNSRLQETNSELKLSESIISNTSEGILLTTVEGLIIDVNPAYCDMTGYQKSELVGQSPKSHLSHHHGETFYDKLWITLRRDGKWFGEVRNHRKNGSVFPQLLTINAVYDENNDVSHYVGLAKDISEIKTIEKRLEELAYFDPLTGLPNRILYRDRLKQAIQVAKRKNKKVALMWLDLDRFKLINDSLGHLAGDDLLKQVAQRIQDRLRHSDTVSRYGGDEFVIIIDDLDNLDLVYKVAQDIIKVVEEPYTLGHQEAYISISIGISIYPDDGVNIETLNSNADIAMYQAKKAGLGQYCLFQPEMAQQANERINIEYDLHRAVENKELTAYFQPKVDIKTGLIIGMEALVRWHHPERGLIMPDQFIPFAEETGFVTKIDLLVLSQACRQAKSWLDQGYRLTMAVNLSAVHFIQAGIVENIQLALAESQLPAHLLDLELTESTIMTNPGQAVKLVSQIRELGIKVSIDDFGTGYSSMTYLQAFAINNLKIDRSFFKQVTDNPEDATIVRTIISLAANLGLEVIAEGIETKAQVDFLLEHNCRYAQGYYFSKPKPAEEIEQLLIEQYQ